MQTSEITVRWTPETSTRVASIQIQSRIALTNEWTEQAAAFDPTIGEFRFTSNAPATEVEVRTRYRMVSGVFGAWTSRTILTAPAVVEYDTVLGTPTKLGDINEEQQAHIEGIAPGATVGAVVGGNLVDQNGQIWVPPVYELDIEAVRAEIDKELAEAKVGLDADISAARGEAAKVATDLAGEVSRAKGAEGSLTTLVQTAQGRADSAHTAISTETTQRVDGDTALANRASKLESSGGLGGNLCPNSTLDFKSSTDRTIPGWTFGGDLARYLAHTNWPDANYYLPGVNVLVSYHPGAADDTYSEYTSDHIPVRPGDWMQVYAYCNNHRAYSYVFAYLYDVHGNVVSNSGLGKSTMLNALGNSLSGYEIVGNKSFQIPTGIASARVVLRHEGSAPGMSDGYAWYLRPYFGFSREGQAEWNAYAPGDASKHVNSLSARITEEATTRTNAVDAVASRASTLETQMSGTGTSGLATLIKAAKQNLADVAWWKKTAPIPWGLNGGRRNEIVDFPHGNNFGGLAMPDGSSGDAWLCESDAGGHNAGGWDGGTFSVPLDPDKSYRFTVPIAALTDNTRSSYWGTNGVCYLNTTTPHPNPYFAVKGNLPLGRWYLFVGYIFPRNSVGRTHDGAGVYDMLTGEKIIAGENYCFRPDGSQPIHRAYQFYTQDHAYQAFGRPVVELVDGSETPFPAFNPAIRAANARIALEETTRSSAVSALANRATTLEAKLAGTEDSTIAARIRDEATARSNADNALGGRITTIETNYVTSGTAASIAQAKVNDEATARSNADSALGTRISTIETSYVSADTAASIAAAKVADEATARSNADGGLATRASNLETRAGNLESSVSTQSGAITTLQGRASAYWSTTAVAGNNRAQLTVKADANGGAGVDIVGDVNFSGNLNVGPDSGQRTKITNSGVFVYDANGTLRVRLGLF